jgi:hypothetical protein
MKRELGEVILERDFKIHHSDGSAGTVKLRVGKTYPKSETSGHLRWFCPCQLVGIGNETVQEMPGIDSVDALLTSLMYAHLRLKDYIRTDNLRITWLGEDHLGLPDLDVADDENENSEHSAIFEEIFEEFFRNFRKDTGQGS